MFQFKLKDAMIPIVKAENTGSDFIYNNVYDLYMPVLLFEFPKNIDDKNAHLFWDFIDLFSPPSIINVNSYLQELLRSISQWSKQIVRANPFLTYKTIYSYIVKSYNYVHDNQHFNLMKLDIYKKMSEDDQSKIINYVIMQKYNFYKIIMECNQAASYIIESKSYNNATFHTMIPALEMMSSLFKSGIVTPNTTGTTQFPENIPGDYSEEDISEEVEYSEEEQEN